MKIPKSHIEEILEQEYVRARKMFSADPDRPITRIPLRDQQQILRTDIREILAGGKEIYDDRKPRPR
jgi:hypothetical protein